MPEALKFKLRPAGPWRSGPDTGDRNQVDLIYHSDTLFSAVTFAMKSLGELDTWLADTAGSENGSAVAFSSLFPFCDGVEFLTPPRTAWPPAATGLSAGPVRWRSARFVPRSLVESAVAGQPVEEDRWTIDGLSECLVPAGTQGPFRTALRGAAAVDRISGAMERHLTACLEVAQGAGLWGVAGFRDDDARARWSDPLKAALRLLADTGFGGERSRGWGRAEQPEFVEGALAAMVFGGAGEGGLWWMLSLYSPAASDVVDWERGSYGLVTRGGRVESPAGSGQLKKVIRMLSEGSVIASPAQPRGAAPDVAPDGFAHPVYRSGFALSVPLPAQVQA